ncbi:hypothetical protein AAHC03_013184 [Spirometra sp. Aus1]
MFVWPHQQLRKQLRAGYSRLPVYNNLCGHGARPQTPVYCDYESRLLTRVHSPIQLRACLLRWQSEFSRPFSLYEARKWAKDYLLANGGNVETVEKFIDFFLSMGYIRPVSGKNARTLKFFFDSSAVSSIMESGPASDRRLTLQLPATIITRTGTLSHFPLSVKLLRKIVSLLHDKSEQDLHAAIHSRQNNSARTLLPLEACTLCARWLLSVGKNIQLSLQSIDGDACLKLAQDQAPPPPPQLLAYLDYLEKWPRCSLVLEDDANLNAMKHSLISAILTTLRTDVRFDSVDSRTVKVIKFVLETDELQSPLRRRTTSEIPMSEKRKRLRSLSPSVPFPPSNRLLALRGLRKGSPVIQRAQSTVSRSWRKSWSFTDFSWQNRLVASTTELPGKNSADTEEDTLTLLIAMFPPLLRAILVAITRSIRRLLSTPNYTTGEPHANADFFASTFSSILFPLSSPTEANKKDDWRVRFLYHLLTPKRPARSFDCLIASVFGRDCKEMEKVSPVEPVTDEPKQTRSVGLQTSAPTGEICKALSALSLTALADSSSSSSRPSLVSAPLGDSTNLSQTSKTTKACSAEAQQIRSNIAINLGRWRQADDHQRLAKLESSAELLQLLNHILLDRSMDPRVKLRHLKQFQTSHGDVFWLRFGDVQTANDYFRRLQQRIDRLPTSPSGISKLGSAIKVKKGSLPPTS